MALYEFRLLDGDELAAMPFVVDFDSPEEAITHAIQATDAITTAGIVCTRLLLIGGGTIIEDIPVTKIASGHFEPLDFSPSSFARANS